MFNPYSIGSNFQFKQKDFNMPKTNNFNGTVKNNQSDNSANFLMKNNSRFVSNVNPVTTMNQQERVINFGQDSNENSFKKILRKPTISNLIQNTSYNIITGAPYTKSSQNYSSTKNEKLDDLFFSFKNSSLVGNVKNKNQEITNNITYSAANSINSKNFQPKESLPTTRAKNLTMKETNLEDMTKTNRKENFLQINNNQSLTNLNEINSMTGFSIKEYSLKLDQNVKCRNTMEDTWKVVDSFNRNSDAGFFGIFDGHGGSEVANFAKDRIAEVFEKNLNNSKEKSNDPNYIENLLNASFLKVDEEVKFLDSDNVGTTATVVYITKETDLTKISRKVVYCANVGDSRCVLVTNFGSKRLSYDHKVSDTNEASRIISSGGVIFRGRVFGSLILSRAIGDFAMKPHGVVANPSISKHYINERDRYIVIASDGVWDVISDEELYRLHLTVSNSDEFTKLIVKTALTRGSEDNISCIVIKLF